MHTEPLDTASLRLSELPLSEAALADLARLLDERRHSSLAESEHIAESLCTLLSSRSESTADDEHDPEGPTLSSEWSRLQALRTDTVDDLAAIEAALERMRDGVYGVCVHCGRQIGEARLRARPTAELCISCAVAAER